MAKNLQVGINGSAKQVKNWYVGVDGIARKIKSAYVGKEGVARQYWESIKTYTINSKDIGYYFYAPYGGAVGNYAVFSGKSTTGNNSTSSGVNKIYYDRNIVSGLLESTEFGLTREKGATNKKYLITPYPTSSNIYNENLIPNTIDGIDNSYGKYHSACNFNDNFIFAGGEISGSTTPQSLVRIVDENFLISSLEDLTYGVNESSSISNSDYCLVAGGQISNNANVANSKSTINVYDKNLVKKDNLDLSVGKFFMCAAYFNEKFVFAGGANIPAVSAGTLSYYAATNIIEIFDNNLISCNNSSMTNSGLNMCCTVMDNKLFIAGGLKGYGYTTAYEDVYIFNSDVVLENTLQLSQGRYGIAAVNLYNKNLFFGGVYGSKSVTIAASTSHSNILDIVS